MISVIIPTLNEENFLPSLLGELEKQTLKDFEIIVSDAHSKDRTREIAEKHGCRVVDGGLPAKARNAGAEAAEGDFFVFLDADIKITKSFLEKAFNEFQERYCEVAICDYHPDIDDSKLKVLFDFYNDYMRSFQYFRPASGGAFIMVTRRLFLRVGGFDENMKLREDHDFVRRCAKVAKLGVLDSVSIKISTRRMRKEGLFNHIMKMLRSEAYALFDEKLPGEIIDYSFGEFDEYDKEKRRTDLERTLRKLRIKFRRLTEKLNISESELFNKMKNGKNK